MSTTSSREPRTKRTYHHGDLRAALIHRAVEVVSRQGIEALSLRALAKDLGVTHSAPFRHFRTKSELLSAVASDGFHRLTATIDASGQMSADPIDNLKAAASAYVSWAVANREQHNAMRNPDVMRYADANLKQCLRRFYERQRQLVGAAQAAGWRRAIDGDRLMFQLVATLAGAAILLSDTTYRETMFEVINPDFFDWTLDGLFAEVTDSALGSSPTNLRPRDVAT